MLAQQLTSPVLLFENSLGQIIQEPDQQLLCLHWHAGPRDLALVQPLFQQLLWAQYLSHFPKLLIDERLGAPFSETAKAWLIEDGLPHLASVANIRSVACVMATDVFARLSAVPIVAQAQQLNLPYRSFAKELEARSWLQQP